MEASAVAVRLANHDARLESHHHAIGSLRDTGARHETEITVLKTELRETREDLGEIKVTLAETRIEQREEMTWVRRYLLGAIITGAGLMVSTGGLAVAIANAS